jgi:hypothetical protein
MQDSQAEVSLAKSLKGRCTSLLLPDALVGDSEDVEYAQFVVDGVRKKASETFKMTGLTGSTNGHFGGVASKTSRTWLRKKRQASQQ